MLQVIKKINLLLNRQQKIRLVIIIVMMIIGGFLEMLGVSLILPLVSSIMEPDIIETNKYAKMICEIFDLHSSRTFMILIIAGLILVFLFKNLFLVFQTYVQFRFVYNNRFSTQKKLLDTYLHRPYEYFLHASTGEIIRVVQSDTTGAFGLLTTLLGFFTEMAISIALVLTIFIVDPKITIFIGFILIGLMVLLAKVIKPMLRKAGLSQQKNGALMNKWLLQSINGIKELKVMKKEAFFSERYDIYGRQTISAEKRNAVFGSVPRLMIETICMCSMLSMVAILIYTGKNLEVMVPSLSAFAMAAIKLLPSANRILAAINSIAFQEPSLDKLLENLKLLKEDENTGKFAYEGIPEGNTEKQVLTMEKQIELSHITYHYPNASQNVLQDASVVIPVGSSVGIVGVSGAGKSTAVDILLGLLKPQEGKVLTDGLDIKENYEGWLACIGYIPQMIFMMDDSIRANVAFGFKEDEIEDADVWEALEEAQLADFVRELPMGLDTQIGERGVRISGGQRQRIGIARALYTKPKLLIFDEATSALDNETEAAIMESINSLHGKKTMIIIAHRLVTIEGCDMVYRVGDCKIIRER